MTPDDPRHGTNAGHVAGCREKCCSRAKLRYDKLRILERSQGIERLVPSIGFQRRVRALQAIGWSRSEIGALLGIGATTITSRMEYKKITPGNHAAMVALYDTICMTPGSGPKAYRNRLIAARKGWQPPLAWDDETIDDPNAEPWKPSEEAGDLFDEVVVLRAMNGQRVSASPIERAEVIRRWRSAGRSLTELERIQHWNTHRDLKGAA